MTKYKLKIPGAMTIARLFICVSLILSVGPRLAFALDGTTGQCDPVNGPGYYRFNYNATLTSPDQNKAGLQFPDIFEWNLGGSIVAKCDWRNSGSTFYFKGDSNGHAAGHSAGWFILNNNIEYQPEIGIYNDSTQTTDFYLLPFTNVKNNITVPSNLYLTTTNFYSGSVGRLSLYFRRPFVGQLVIPPTVIARTYAATRLSSYGSTPISLVEMKGTVTVPQSCNINEGDIINVDFGNIAANAFKAKGQPPTGLAKNRLDFSIKCSNISNGVAVSLEFNGAPDTNDATALKTDNKDIAIRLTDTSNKTISAKSGELPVNFNYSNQTGTSAIQLYPISTTGNMPDTGQFNSQVTVTVDIE